MRRLCAVLAVATVLACSSSRGPYQDVGEATVTESKSDVRNCQYVAQVTATVDLQTVGGDRAAALELLIDRLRNNALHKRCDTVYLVTVEETTVHMTAVGEGYTCRSRGISDGPGGGTLP